MAGAAIQGQVHGGQQSISGAISSSMGLVLFLAKHRNNRRRLAQVEALLDTTSDSFSSFGLWEAP